MVRCAGSPGKVLFPVKQNPGDRTNSINFLFDYNTFNNQFLDTYPCVNAKLIDSIFKNTMAKECDVNIILINPASSDADLAAKFSSFGSRAGFVLLNPDTMPRVLAILRREQFPYISFAAVSEGNLISHDGYFATCHAIEHLIRISGRENIAFLNPAADFAYTGDRLKGYRDTLRKQGLPFREELVFTQPYTNENFLSFVQSNFQAGKLDAVFAASFEIGRKAVNALKSCDLRIPEDIAVIVFFDLPEFSTSVPTISCVNVPLESIASAILEKLFEMINFGFRDDVRVILKDELIIRESC